MQPRSVMYAVALLLLAASTALADELTNDSNSLDSDTIAAAYRDGTLTPAIHPQRFCAGVDILSPADLIGRRVSVECGTSEELDPEDGLSEMLDPTQQATCTQRNEGWLECETAGMHQSRIHAIAEVDGAFVLIGFFDTDARGLVSGDRLQQIDAVMDIWRQELLSTIQQFK